MSTALYATLNIQKNATLAEIKIAYRSLALKHHPDRGGDAEKFKEISNAHEILTNTNKRELYDRYGLEGVERGGAPHGGGGGGFFSQRGGPQAAPLTPTKGDDVNACITITLAELFRGTTRVHSVQRSVRCVHCDGRGGQGDPITCTECSGAGIRVQVRQIAPGMMQQMQLPCPACRSLGKRIPEHLRCTQCSATGLVQEQHSVSIRIRAGHDLKIPVVVFAEGNCSPKAAVPNGDVNVQLKLAPHAFEGVSSTAPHLVLKHTVNLGEALTGAKILVPHFYSRIDHATQETKTLVINSPPGVVIRPNSVFRVEGAGLPNPDGPGSGDLFILFDVHFPQNNTLSAREQSLLKECFGGAASASASAAAGDNDANANANANAEHTSQISFDSLKQFIQNAETASIRKSQTFAQEQRGRNAGGGGGGRRGGGQQQHVQCPVQ